MPKRIFKPHAFYYLILTLLIIPIDDYPHKMLKCRAHRSILNKMQNIGIIEHIKIVNVCLKVAFDILIDAASVVNFIFLPQFYSQSWAQHTETHSYTKRPLFHFPFT